MCKKNSSIETVFQHRNSNYFIKDMCKKKFKKGLFLDLVFIN
jgi:hypothetical protein